MPEIENKFYLNLDEKKRVLQLWDSEYPELLNLHTLEGLEQYFARTTSHHHYLARENDVILGWCLVFERDNENWFSVVVDPEYSRRGVGSYILKKVLQEYRKLFGWVVDSSEYFKKDGSRYQSPLDFYLKLGFKAEKDVIFRRNGLEAIRIYYSQAER